LARAIFARTNAVKPRMTSVDGMIVASISS
jgi:hypothetical protein